MPYGRRIVYLSNLVKREVDNIDSIMSMNEISGSNCWILCFIHKSETDVYQKDIEKHFGITRSTASKVISLMEKKELIIRESDDSDARLKKLVLTDKAVELVLRAIEDLDIFEKRLIEGLNEEEKKAFLSIMEKMEKNLSGGSK